MWSSIALVAVGILSPVALVLALFMLYSVMDYAARSRSAYAVTSVARFKDTDPDLRDYLVKVEKKRGGYYIKLINYNNDLEAETVHVITLEKVDPPTFD